MLYYISFTHVVLTFMLNRNILISNMACANVASVFGILEMVTVTSMETAKISKILKCSKLSKILQKC